MVVHGAVQHPSPPPPARLHCPARLCVAAARYMIWVLQDIPEMNALGVERMIRGLALLQVSTGGAARGGGGGAAPPPVGGVGWCVCMCVELF
jgi:hypothetical protein